MKLQSAGFVQVINEIEVASRKRKSAERKIRNSNEKVLKSTTATKLNDGESMKIFEVKKKVENIMKSRNKKAKNDEINDTYHMESLGNVSSVIKHGNISPQSGFIIDTPNRYYSTEKKRRKKLRS